MRTVCALLSAVVVVGALVACSPQESKTEEPASDTPQPSAESSVPEVPEEPGGEVKVLPAGSKIVVSDLGNTLDAVIEAANFDASSMSHLPRDPDDVVVGVPVTLTNTGKAADDIMGSLYLHVGDSTESEGIMSLENVNPSGTINPELKPGETMEVTFLYSIPKADLDQSTAVLCPFMAAALAETEPVCVKLS